jgi:ABC-type phosphate/phosphonate transport system substrate-binding protein/ABC-type uncharacterized transport system substrate-binding protein
MFEYQGRTEIFLQRIALVLFCMSMLVSAGAQQDGDKHRKDLLILHSYHQGLSWTDQLTRGIVGNLREEYSSDELEIHIEYMDTKRFSLEDVEDHIFSLLETRYKDTHMDVVLACDNNALAFMKKYHDTLFPQVPVVFTGINYFNNSLIDDRNLYTGVLEISSPDGTLDLMRTMHPDLKRCVVITDNTVTGQRELASAREKLGSQYQGVLIEYWDAWVIEKINAAIVDLSPETDGVLLLTYNRSPGGQFFNYEDSARQITSNTDCPVYGIWDFYIGTGVLGGRMIHSVSQGSEAVDLVLRVLKGESPGEIPIVDKDLTRTLLDAHVLRKRGLALNLLPAGAMAMKGETVVYESGKREPFRVGVQALNGEEKTFDKWQYLGEYLTWNVDEYYFEIVPLTYDEMHEKTQKSEVDFVLLNPLLFVELASQNGFRPIATQESLYAGKASSRMGAVIFVRADRDDLQSLKNLQGQTVGLLKNERLCDWRMVKREMIDQGLEPEEHIQSYGYFDTHEDIVNAVLGGTVDFGVVRTGVLEDMEAQGKTRMQLFRILSEKPSRADFPFRRSTDLYPDWTFAGLSHIADEVTHDVEDALLMMRPDDQLAQKIAIAGWIDSLNLSSVRDCLMVLGEGPYGGPA